MIPSKVRAFPNLARAVDVGVAARAATRLWRSTFASLSALGEARLSAHRTARERAEALSALARELLAIHGVEVEPLGVVPAMPCLLIANQTSPLDALVVLSQIPAVPVVPAEIAGWPIVGPTATALGARFTRKAHDAHVMRDVLEALRTGVPVLHHGGFDLAILADLPVVPISIRSEASSGEGFWRFSTRVRTRVELVVRAPLWGRPGEAHDDFERRVRTATDPRAPRTSVARWPAVAVAS